MGQALRRVVGSSRPSTVATPRPVSRPSVDVKPPSSKPGETLTPEQNLGEWDPQDPNFKSLVHEVAGSISSRPGGAQEMGPAKVREHFTKPLPKDRHTTVLSGPSEEEIVKPGTLNVAHLRELFIFCHESEGKPVDVESLAAKFQVDPVLMRRVLKHYWLHSAAVPAVEDVGQKQEVREHQVASGA